MVAKDLLGAKLVRVEGKVRMSGIIVETEAYRGSKDPASHAFRGRTKRNEVMFGPAGHAYVYFSMGAHHCLNVTTEGEGTPAAVLFRAIQPEEGIDAMKRNKGSTELKRLAAGPGNLTRAFGIGRDFNGEDLVSSEVLFLEEGRRVRRVGISTRIGVSGGASFRWRFFVKDNPFVSRGKPSTPTQNP